MNDQFSSCLCAASCDILVVDDEIRICQSLKDLLSSRKYHVQTCNSGTEALALLGDRHFDLALIDIFMSDMTGFQLFEQLSQRGVDTRVIIMTGWSSTDSAVKALRMGVDDYLKKPLDVDELYNVVDQVLEQQWLARQLNWHEHKYRVLFESSFDAICIVDPETGTIVDCNAAAVTQFGKRSKTDMIGTTLVSHSPQHQSDSFSSEWLSKKYFRQAMETGKKEFEWIYSRDDGSRFYSLVSLSVFTMGKKSFLMGVSKDNTYRKQAEQDKEELIQILKESLNNVKTLSGLVHICANCKKIRDDKGHWKQLEAHIQEQTHASFSHSLCPECCDKLYSHEDWYQNLVK